MLTSRNIIAATILIAVISLVGAVVSVLGQSPGGELGSDSFGTRGNGFRAIYDVLRELDVTAERSYLPDPDDYPADATLVLWGPLDAVVQTEPAYLDAIAGWVRDGGRVVVAPSPQSDVAITAARLQTDSDRPRVSLLEELGLTGVSIESVSGLTASDAAGSSSTPPAPIRPQPPPNLDNFDEFRDVFDEVFSPHERPTQVVTLHVEGSFASLESAFSRARVPADEVQVILSGRTEPAGRIAFTDATDDRHTLVAAYPVGRGEIVIVSEPSLIRNAHVAEQDNSVLAVHLFVGDRDRVIFEEFYHGLTIRGNPLWLWTKLPYAAMTVALLFVVGMWNWRHGIFLGPRQRQPVERRRSIGEYVEAMARFLLPARGSRRYVLSEVRDGTLWAFRRKLGLQPGQENAETVLATLVRRYPTTADELQAALQHIDAIVRIDGTRQKQRPSEVACIQALKKVSDCLSNSSTVRSATRSIK